MASHQGAPHGMPVNPNPGMGNPMAGVSSSGPTGNMIPSGQNVFTGHPTHLNPQPSSQVNVQGTMAPVMTSTINSQSHLVQQQINPNMQTKPISQQPQVQQESTLTSVEKIKALVPHLKKSLINLMRLAAESMKEPHHASAVEKALEEFFSYCDQLEMHLSIALEGFNQVIQHKKYLNPEYLKYSFAPGQTTDVVQQYQQFSTVIRSQVALATSLHDALLSCAENLTVTSAAPAQTRTNLNGHAQPGTTLAAGGLHAGGAGSAATPNLKT